VTSAGALHADALSVLRAWAPPNARQETLRQEYVAHLERHLDGLQRSCRPDHITASVLILSADHAHALLTLHAKANQWFQMGGHCEPQDTALGGAALREAVEESGIHDLELDPDPVQLNAHDVPFCGSGGDTRHLDVRFLAIAAPEASHAVSDESLDVRWWAVDELPTDEPNMHELVDLALARTGRQSTSI
jgi:8-oxo-dGTP pyrophosphatase MutT (NUDIX family)